MAARCVVVVGDAMLDIYLAGDAERISPEAPVPVVTVHTRRAALGGAANVAANVSAIGAECRLVAVIGDDARGDSQRTELAQNRLADRHIVAAAARPTTAKTRGGHDDAAAGARPEKHTTTLQSHSDTVCRLLLEKHKSIITRGLAPI